MRFKQFLPVIIGLSLISVAVCGCKEKNAYAPPPPATVTVTKPVVKNANHFLYKTGRFSANQEVAVTARVSGVLEQRLFEEGLPVKAGDTLFIIEQTQYKAAVEEAKAALQSAQASAKAAQTALKRKSAAYKDRAISEIDVILAQADYDKTLAAVENAKAMLTVAELNYSYTEVKAPVSGRIGRSLVDVGNLVGPTQNTLLTTIVDDSNVKIYFSVTENELAVYLNEDAPRPEEKTHDDDHRFEIAAATGHNGGFKYKGAIDFVDNAVDMNTGTILLRGRFDNADNNLVAGMFAQVRVPLRVVENALTIPEIALAQSQAGYFVYVIDADNIARMTNVKVKFVQEGIAVIEDGLTADSNVVINGMALIQDGRPVNPVAAQQADQAEAPAEVLAPAPAAETEAPVETLAPAPAAGTEPDASAVEQPETDGDEEPKPNNGKATGIITGKIAAGKAVLLGSKAGN